MGEAPALPGLLPAFSAAGSECGSHRVQPRGSVELLSANDRLSNPRARGARASEVSLVHGDDRLSPPDPGRAGRPGAPPPDPASLMSSFV